MEIDPDMIIIYKVQKLKCCNNISIYLIDFATCSRSNTVYWKV